MKVREKYSLVINRNTASVTLCRNNHWWVNYIQSIASCGICIYDCSFNEVVFNLKELKKQGFYIGVKK